MKKVTKSDKLYWIWLADAIGIGSERINPLLEYFDTAEDIYRADKETLEGVTGLTAHNVKKLLNKELSEAQKILEEAYRLGAEVITLDDERYPPLLAKTSGPPCVLYTRGIIPDWESIFTVGIVGTRDCSEYGSSTAAAIAANLAKRGASIVTGMAKGVDVTAELAAAKYKGFTIGVIGTGIDGIYPKENKRVFEWLYKYGLVITEFPPGTIPYRSNFPTRNRVISGLSKCLVVTEAPEKSGSLITANCALAEGREVFALPGNINLPNSRGTNELINRGATAIVTIGDIYAAYKTEIDAAKKVYPDILALANAGSEAAEAPIDLSDVSGIEAAASDKPDAAVNAESESIAPETEASKNDVPKTAAPKKETTKRSRTAGKTSKGAANTKTSAAPAKSREYNKENGSNTRAILREGSDESQILQLFDGDEVLSIDTIVRRSGLPVDRAMTAVTCLDIAGELERLPGNSYRLT